MLTFFIGLIANTFSNDTTLYITKKKITHTRKVYEYKKKNVTHTNDDRKLIIQCEC